MGFGTSGKGVGITTSGQLIANSAKIQGEITATKASIGSWIMADGYLTSEDNNGVVAIGYNKLLRVENILNDKLGKIQYTANLSWLARLGDYSLIYGYGNGTETIKIGDTVFYCFGGLLLKQRPTY